MNNSYDPSIYPSKYSEYVNNPYRFATGTNPIEGGLLITTVSDIVPGRGYYNTSHEFILRIDDITSGKPEPIVSKTGSFWCNLMCSDVHTRAFITIDKSEVIIVDTLTRQYYHYSLMPNQQP